MFDQLPENLDLGRVRSVPSKKRSAPSGRPGSSSSLHTTIPTSQSSLHNSGYTRGSQISTSTYPTTFSHSTLDPMQATNNQVFPDNFPANFNDFMGMDIQQGTPESTTSSAATSTQRNNYVMPSAGPHNPVNKLDSLMFPSEDPFAYPNQPMMELGFPGKEPVNMGDQGQDMQLFLTGTFDDVENQIFGQPPPYMMHQQGQQSMNLSSQMYSPAMLGMQQQQHHQRQHHQQQSHPMGQQRSISQTQAIHQGHSMSSRRTHNQRYQEKQIQQMFTEQGMQADWGGFFGSGRGGFQGM